MMRSCLVLGLALLSPVQEDEKPPGLAGFPGLAAGRAPRVEIAWNRLYDYDQIHGLLERLEATWPELLTHEVIGHSVESREMRVYTLNDPAGGPADAKPAMWVDANVHGNEVQGGEVVVYLAWYLLENRASNERVAKLLEGSAFYLLPMVNPDGRAHWFQGGHSANSSRTGVMPLDDDLDGEFDEDPADDLDGDGSITMMRKLVPGEGEFRLNPDDPRLMDRVPPNDEGRRGDWTILGQEGIDNDGDGRLNEDEVGGYDMNRSWPSLWMPDHVQSGAGPYPLYWPEARSIARFLLAHPNVAAVQSFHNAGGMILRGPGAESFGEYPRGDVRVYDELGSDGEKMLPFYDYMVIWKDLYTVFGGFVNWTYEGLGIISFTNELWTETLKSPDQRLESGGRGFGRGGGDGDFWFDDKLLSGAGFVPWKPYTHPLYGEVEIGGFRKDVGRVPPSFLIEEMLHRNAMFCLLHAEAMPSVEISEPVLTDLGGGAKAVDVIVRNLHPIPTRTAMASQKKMGRPDLLTLSGEGIEVLAGGLRTDRFRPERLELQEHDPARIVAEQGVDGRDELRVRWIFSGTGKAEITVSGEKFRDVRRELVIE